MTEVQGTELQQRIDVIESGYEFLLAYAAQGRETDKGAGKGQDVRQFLQEMEKALQGLGAVCVTAAEALDGKEADSYRAFLDAVEDDSGKALGAIRLVLSREHISSQLVDNLNANVHVRALLTDLFLIDNALA